MPWQDFLFMTGGVVFCLALIPALRAKHKPPICTSFMTGTVLYSFGIAYATLGLWLGFVAIVVNASMWYALMMQEIKGGA